MSRPAPSTAGILLRLSSILLLCAAALADATPAHARIGVPKKLKDATDKATGKSDKQAAPAADNQVVFDDVTLELTSDRIDHMLAACQAAGKAGDERSALVAKLDKAFKERDELLAKHGEEINVARTKRSEAEQCYSSGITEAGRKKFEAYAQRTSSDPSLLAKYAQIAQQYNAAIQQGDSVALQKAQDAMLADAKLSHEDSLQVRQACGSPPPITPEEQKLDALDKEIASLNEQLRAFDQKLGEEQAKQSQMTPQQFAMAAERIQMYLQWKANPKTTPPPLTESEIQAMEKRLQELKKCFG
jgi:hypothetical protein